METSQQIWKQVSRYGNKSADMETTQQIWKQVSRYGNKPADMETSQQIWKQISKYGNKSADMETSQDKDLPAIYSKCMVSPLIKHPTQIMTSTLLLAAKSFAVSGNSKAPGTYVTNTLPDFTPQFVKDSLMP